MAPLRFRAWHRESKEMGEVSMIRFDVSIVIVMTDGGARQWSLNECDLIQATGLKDKNGVEIFEGDIMNRNGLVEYQRGEDGGPDYGCLHMGYAFDECNPPETDEIIGNIYQNPELLSVTPA